MSRQIPRRPIAANYDSTVTLPSYSATVTEPPPSYNPHPVQLSPESSQYIELQERRHAELDHKQQQHAAGHAAPALEAQRPVPLPQVQVVDQHIEERHHPTTVCIIVGYTIGIGSLAVLVIFHVMTFFLRPFDESCAKADSPRFLKGYGKYFEHGVVHSLSDYASQEMDAVPAYQPPSVSEHLSPDDEGLFEQERRCRELADKADVAITAQDLKTGSPTTSPTPANTVAGT